MRRDHRLSKLITCLAVVLFLFSFSINSAIAGQKEIIKTSVSVVDPVAPVVPLADHIFLRTLTLGSSSEDVRYLQQFLNREGFVVATGGAGSAGNESTYFGTRTRDALIRFQEAHASEVLAPIDQVRGTGTFGPLTRTLVNRLLRK